MTIDGCHRETLSSLSRVFSSVECSLMRSQFSGMQFPIYFQKPNIQNERHNQVNWLLLAMPPCSQPLILFDNIKYFQRSSALSAPRSRIQIGVHSLCLWFYTRASLALSYQNQVFDTYRVNGPSEHITLLGAHYSARKDKKQMCIFVELKALCK